MLTIVAHVTERSEGHSLQLGEIGVMDAFEAHRVDQVQGHLRGGRAADPHHEGPVPRHTGHVHPKALGHQVVADVDGLAAGAHRCSTPRWPDNQDHERDAGDRETATSQDRAGSCSAAPRRTGSATAPPWTDGPLRRQPHAHPTVVVVFRAGAAAHHLRPERRRLRVVRPPDPVRDRPAQ